MSDQVTLIIDGHQVSVAADSTILEAAKSIDIEIPTLCHHQNLPHFTSCFICVVEVAGRRNLVPACSTVVVEGMEVATDTQQIRETRKLCLELLLSDHVGDCVAPCTLKCPAGCNIQGFMSSLVDKNIFEAIETIKEALPIPAALGRICPRPCESQCRRVRVDEPLAIGWLHRFAADQDAANERVYTPEVGPESGKHVAIIGAGPAGMSAAYFLRQLGHAVTVFEAEHEAGGMLRWGIPAYRLPRAELARELDAIIKMGVTIKYGHKLGRELNINELQKSFAAVFIAVGAPLSSKLAVTGEELPTVLGGVEFLKRAAQGETVDLGQRVIVIGGGNTAVDAVRTARRLGANDITLLYRRTRAEMPALPIEVDEAEKEGVEFHFLAAPLSITNQTDQLALKCQKMELGPAGPDGRRRPVPVQGGEFELLADSIISAIGQRVDLEALTDAGLSAIVKDGSINHNPQTLETSLPGVFVGGDLAYRDDKRIAVWAVAAGRQAAVSIDSYLRQTEHSQSNEFRISMGATPDEVTPSRFAGIEQINRVIMPELEMEERVSTFREVELGLQAADAQNEAKRCLNCGCQAARTCYIRRLAAHYGAQPERWAGAVREYSVDTTVAGLIMEPGKCINCGICVRMGADSKEKELFGFVNRGFDARIKSYPEFVSELEAQVKRCSEACPTGALVLQEDLGKGCRTGCNNSFSFHKK